MLRVLTTSTLPHGQRCLFIVITHIKATYPYALSVVIWILTLKIFFKNGYQLFKSF